MGWELLIPIIAQYGIPLAESLYTKWSSGNAPTQADFDELKLLASTKGTDEMLSVLKAQNIDPNSDAGKAFLTLVK